jgi:hypothetical protein
MQVPLSKLNVLQELKELEMEEDTPHKQGMKGKVQCIHSKYDRLEALKAGAVHESKIAEQFSSEAHNCRNKAAAARQDIKRLEKAANSVSVCIPRSKR